MERRLPETGKIAALSTLSLGTDLHFTAVCSVFPRKTEQGSETGQSMRKEK